MTRRRVQSRKLARARVSAEALSHVELRQLDEWLHDRLAEAETASAKTVSRAVVEERKTPAGTLRLEFVRCGKESCKKCARGPAHGPYWYRYWKEQGRTRSKYVGKQLKSGSR